MQRIYADAETYYDREFSLTKMTTPEYILDPRFKVLGWSIAIDDGPVEWFEGEELPDLDWANSEVIAHNFYFDGSILKLHYGISVGKRACTASMARALLPVKDHRLVTVSSMLGVGQKGDGLTEGAEQSDQKLIDYAIQDTVLCRKIYKMLRPAMPDSEMDVMDISLRWGTDAILQVDVPRMRNAALKAEHKRKQLIEMSEIAEDILMSNKQFPILMEQLGVEVPMKASPSNGWPVPALALGDAEFHAMMAKYPQYTHIWRGRIAAKSNIEIHKPRKLINIAMLTENHLLPMPLRYCGAHTGRFSGSDGVNVQSMPRKSEMRKSIIAPKGHVIVVADSSQIELRLNAWLSGEEWILEEQRKPKGDVYRKAAAAQFGIPPEEVTPDQRQFGKVITLGAGYSMSADKFRSYCGSGPIGLSPILLTEEEAQTAITNYRKTNPNIVRNWKNGDQLIKAMHSGVEMQFKCLRTAKEAILLPNGLALFYPNLKCSESATGGNSWSFGYDHKTYTYGAKIIENIVQALARIVITDQLLAMEAEGLVSVGSTHDEILVVCKEENAEETFNKMIKIMSIPPKWCSDLPLAAEGGWAKNYSK